MRDLTLLALLIIAATGASRTGAAAGGVGLAAQATGSIAGTVQDAATTAPLSGVVVRVYTSAGDLAGSATTVNGAYQVDGLAAGTYYARTVVPAGSNYIDELYNGIECLSCQVTTGTPIVVLPALTTSGIAFTLATGGSITGFVRDAATFAGLDGVTVRAYTSGGAAAKDAQTGGGGLYTIGGLPSGSYFARTFVPVPSNHVDELFDDISCGGGCTVVAGTAIAVTAPSSAVAAFDLTATPPSPSLVAGRRSLFTLADAAAVRWASSQAVQGRSYCARLSPDPDEVNPAAPMLAAYRIDGVTPLSAAASSQVCFVAPETESVLFKVTQSDGGPRRYGLAVVETTLWANWYFIGGSYSSYTLLRNTTAADVNARITWTSESGAFAGSELVTIPPGGIAFRDARTTTAGAVAGSVEVAHDGEPQALVGSQTTLSAATGLSFDTLMVQRTAW